MATNQKALIELIKNSLGQANVLTIPRVLVDFTGSLDCALLLSQVIYWSDRGSDPRGWFYKSYAEWTDEICLSEYQVRKGVRQLAKLGFLKTRVRKAPNGNPTVHYWLDWAAFSETFLEFLQDGTIKKFRKESEENAETFISEITTERTPEKGAPAPAGSVSEKSSREGPAEEARHSAVEVYERLTGEQLPPAAVASIAGAGIESAEALALWEQVVKGHVICGYRLTNVGCALDYFHRGEIPQTKSKRSTHNRRSSRNDHATSQPSYRVATRAELGLDPDGE